MVARIKSEHACATLITPYYKEAPWFKELLLLCHAQPLRVDSNPALFFPQSLANSAGIGSTPWEITIMWPINARINAKLVVVSPWVTTWDEVVLEPGVRPRIQHPRSVRVVASTSRMKDPFELSS